MLREDIPTPVSPSRRRHCSSATASVSSRAVDRHHRPIPHLRSSQQLNHQVQAEQLNVSLFHGLMLPRSDQQQQWQPQQQMLPVSYSPVSPTFSDGPFYQPPSPHYTTAPPLTAYPNTSQYIPCVPPHMLFTSTTAAPVLVAPQIISQPLYKIPYMPNNMQSPMQDFAPATLPTHRSPPPPVHVIHTEARKVIITGLPHTIGRGEIKGLVLSRISSSSSSSSRRHAPPPSTHLIQTIELAKHSDGSPKSHAFVVFESQHIAQRAINSLHGFKWQGKKLTARFAKEGVETNDRPIEQELLAHAGPSHTPEIQATDMQITDSSSAGSWKSESTDVTDPDSPVCEDVKGKAKEIELLTMKLADMQSDYRAESSSSSLGKSRRSLPSGNLSSEGEKERSRRMRSVETRHNTPIVVDGSGGSGRTRR